MGYNGNYENVAGVSGGGDFWDGFWGCGGHRRSHNNNNHNNNHNNNNVAGVNAITLFLRRLSPGTRVTLQFDAFPQFFTATFQGFQNGLAVFSNFTALTQGAPVPSGVVRLSPSSINLISV